MIKLPPDFKANFPHGIKLKFKYIMQDQIIIKLLIHNSLIKFIIAKLTNCDESDDSVARPIYYY